MRLDELIMTLDDLDEEITLCARRPWSAAAEAIAVELDEEGRVPPQVKGAGYAYFLDVPTAREVLEVFGDRRPTAEERLRLLLHYAENDAFPDWVYGR